MTKQTKIEQLLAMFARKIIAARKPFIIGVTGSVGKTSTRHAIASILSEHTTVREPEKNYNNQIGIPLTIIGAHGIEESWGPLGWLRIFAKALLVWLLPLDYPEILVLEYGIDHPGDMDQLVAIARPNLTVITTIGLSHREFFDTEEDIAHEKGKLAEALRAKGIFVYNKGDKHVASQVKRTKAETVVSYNAHGEADVYFTDLVEELGVKPRTQLTVQTGKTHLSATIPAAGTAHLEAALAAVAVAFALDIPTEQIVSGLRNYRVIPGRLVVIPGIKKSILIDDSYNAAPLSMKEALGLLARFPGKNKIAVLGDMLELGEDSQASHEEIGQIVAAMKIQQLVTVGELGKIIAHSAVAAGFPKDRVVSFNNSDEAKNLIRNELEPEAVILIKGSQGARMEKITREVLAEPSSAPQVLPRQYGKWLNS